MKKLLVVFLVLALVGPAMADDALDASGSMRVEAYSISNSDFTDSDASDLNYWDQRFRLQLKMTPADGVSAVLRTDITEDTWGKLNGTNRPGLAVGTTATDGDPAVTSASAANGILMIDRAYLSIDKSIVNITGGLNTFNLGQGFAYNNQSQGIQLTVKTPLTVRVGLTKESENGSNADSEDTVPDSQDTDTYFAELGFKNDMMSINVFYGAVIDGRDGDQFEPNVIGATYQGNVGPVKVVAELDFFGGDDGAGGDLVGTQFYGEASMALSDQLTVGTHLVYAMGSDDASETVITNVTTFADYIYPDYYLPHHGPGSLQPLGDGFSVGPNQGAIGIGPYVTYKAMDDLTVAAKVIYLAKAEDAIDPTVEIDSALFYSVGVSWALAPKAALDFGYTGTSVNEGEDFAGDVETYGAFGAILSVSF